MNALLEKLHDIWPHRLNDYLLVTLITVLIWVYAEGRNVRTYQPDDRVPVSVELASSDLVVTAQSVSSIGVEFSAATAEIDKLRPLLGENGIVLRPQITEPGTRSLLLSDELRRADPIEKISANVNWSDPATIEITVDRLVEHEVKIGFDPGGVKLVNDSLTIDPQVVTIRGPEKLFSKLGVDESFTLESEPLVPLESVVAGEPKTIDARVKLPPSLANNKHVSIVHPGVKLTLTIDKAEETIVLPNVPVWIASPPGAQAGYTVKLNEDSRVLTDVKVTGPRDAIAQVRDGTTKIIAILRLNSTEIASGTDAQQTGTAVVRAPAPLVVDPASKSVHYTVERKPVASTP